MEPEIRKSDIVRSVSGRDKGRLMMVLEQDAEYLLLADGRLRRLESPKRKKRKHVSLFAQSDSVAAQHLREGAKLSNSDIRRAINEAESPVNAE